MVRGIQFDVGAAQRMWEDIIPDDGERRAFLRGQLLDCESDRQLPAGRGTAKDAYKETAKNLRLMLAAEGADA